MNSSAMNLELKLSLMRGLWGNIFPDLRQASIEASAESKVIKIRFEFDGAPSEASKEACSISTIEVMADFEEGWLLEEEYLAIPLPFQLSALECLVFQRAEPSAAA